MCKKDRISEDTLAKEVLHRSVYKDYYGVDVTEVNRGESSINGEHAKTQGATSKPVSYQLGYHQSGCYKVLQRLSHRLSYVKCKLKKIWRYYGTK